MTDILNAAEKSLENIPRQSRILVGLSGGADSTALCVCLKKLGFEICAVHVNHLLREQESFRDMDFCENFCKQNDIEFYCEQVDISAKAKAEKISAELAGRNARYEIFEKYLHKCGCDYIAVAHNLTDSLETAVFNLARGAGTRGIRGISKSRGRIIRPLIGCTSKQIRDFLDEQGIKYMVDSTNLTDEYTRNKIRHNILPVLRQISENCEQNFAEFSEIVSAEDSFLESLAEQMLERSRSEYGYFKSEIVSAGIALERRCIARLLRENNLLEFKKVEECVKVLESTGKIQLAENLFFSSNKKEFFIYSVPEPMEDKVLNVGKNIWYDSEITVKILPAGMQQNNPAQNIYKMFTKINLDYGKIKGVVNVRHPKREDKIFLKNNNFHADVRKLLQSRLPQHMRKQMAVVCAGEKVMFVQSLGADADFLPDENTKQVMQLIFKPRRLDDA